MSIIRDKKFITGYAEVFEGRWTPRDWKDGLVDEVLELK